MGYWNDNLARITGAGNLTLGQNADDAAGDTTYPYAKGDSFVHVPLASCLTAPATTGTYIVPTSEARAALTTAGSKGHTIKLAGAAAFNTVLVPVAQVLRSAGGTSGNVGKGFLLRKLYIAYNPITTAILTGMVVNFWTRALADSVAEDGVAYGGTITYENPVGTAVAALPTGANTTGNWVTAAVCPTPAWINTANQDLFAELVVGLNTPTCSIRIVRLGLIGAWALN